MSNKVTSIRGQEVDFDLFEVKQHILNTPKKEETKNRERFINKKRRRTVRTAVDKLLSQKLEPATKAEENVVDKVPMESTEISDPVDSTSNKIIKKK